MEANSLRRKCFLHRALWGDHSGFTEGFKEEKGAASRTVTSSFGGVERAELDSIKGLVLPQKLQKQPELALKLSPESR